MQNNQVAQEKIQTGQTRRITIHRLLRDMVILFFSLFTVWTRGATDAWGAVPPDLQEGMAVRLDPIDLRERAPELPQPNEVYSESFYQNTAAGASEMLRVRHEYTIGSLATRLYLGAVIERGFTAPGAPAMLENASSPELGVLYRPLPFVTLWGEYRYRAIQDQQSLQFKRGVNDPRAGVASGRVWATSKKSVDTEIYGEVTLTPRFTLVPSTSAFVRSEWNAGQFKRATLSLYTELNEMTSPDLLNLGSGRLQFRGGGRGTVFYRGWTGSLFAYRPFTVSSMGSPRGYQPVDGFEGFFVLGGRF